LRLVERAFWEQVWSSGQGSPEAPVRDARRWRSHQDVVLHDGHLGPALRALGAGSPPPRVLEVGCAPARNLLRLHRDHGIDPWGLEYTEAGVTSSRANLATIGVPPEQVLHADLFDDDALRPWWGTFDAVVSFGFLEHFTDPSDAVARHIRLLRPGGLLAVTIPNYQGLGGVLLRALNPSLVPLHNLSLMRAATWKGLFHREDLDLDKAGAFGGPDVGFHTADGRWRRRALRGLRATQGLINLAQRVVPLPDHAAWSAGWIAIGHRRA
jgi:SAM-dependent methyltransferase